MQAGRRGEQLYAVVYKKRVWVKMKSGREREKWVRGYRAPRAEDDNSATIRAALAEKLPEWEAFDMVPSERFPDNTNDDRSIQYGMPLWRDLFSPRQLLCHGTSVEVFREMLEADRAAGELTDVRKAAYGYLALSLDKLLNYNCRMTRWHVAREVHRQRGDSRLDSARLGLLQFPQSSTGRISPSQTRRESATEYCPVLISAMP